MSEQRHDPYAGWAIVELFGHRRLAGRVAQVEQYGQAMLRLDVPSLDGTESTHFYGGGAVYGVHPTTEQIARHVAVACDPRPVQRWELPALRDAPTEERCGGCGELLDDCRCDADPYVEDGYGAQDGPPTGEQPDAVDESAADEDHRSF
jgi:hypothetical protein